MDETLDRSILDASGIVFGYSENRIILDGVGISIDRGDFVGIIGPNGSGKTTMIKCLNKILTPKQGEILLNGEDISGMKRIEVARQIGYVPQSSSEEMSAPTVYEVVMMGRKPRMSWQCSEADEDAVWAIMEELDVAHLASHGFDELSSGQTQRVLMARAIAQEATVLLLDEPTSNLDIRYQLDVMDMVRDIIESRSVSACAIVHDLDLALRYCNKVLLMNDGHVEAFGRSEEVITEDSIRRVYGVDVRLEDLYGRRRLIVIRCRRLSGTHVAA